MSGTVSHDKSLSSHILQREFDEEKGDEEKLPCGL